MGPRRIARDSAGRACGVSRMVLPSSCPGWKNQGTHVPRSPDAGRSGDGSRSPPRSATRIARCWPAIVERHAQPREVGPGLIRKPVLAARSGADVQAIRPARRLILVASHHPARQRVGTGQVTEDSAARVTLATRPGIAGNGHMHDADLRGIETRETGVCVEPLETPHKQKTPAGSNRSASLIDEPTEVNGRHISLWAMSVKRSLKENSPPHLP